MKLRKIALATNKFPQKSTVHAGGDSTKPDPRYDVEKHLRRLRLSLQEGDRLRIVHSGKMKSRRLFRLIAAPHPDESISQRVLENVAVTMP